MLTINKYTKGKKEVNPAMHLNNIKQLCWCYTTFIFLKIVQFKMIIFWLHAQDNIVSILFRAYVIYYTENITTLPVHIKTVFKHSSYAMLSSTLYIKNYLVNGYRPSYTIKGQVRSRFSGIPPLGMLMSDVKGLKLYTL